MGQMVGVIMSEDWYHPSVRPNPLLRIRSTNQLQSPLGNRRRQIVIAALNIIIIIIVIAALNVIIIIIVIAAFTEPRSTAPPPSLGGQLSQLCLCACVCSYVSVPVCVAVSLCLCV